MSLPRRELCKMLSFVFGSSFVVANNSPDVAAQTAQAKTPAANAGDDAEHAVEGKNREKVTGIGGLFFRAHDPAALGRWYQQHLGIPLTPTSYDDPVWEQEAGTTIFSPFPETSDYFGDAHKNWMVNFRVRDLDKMAAQLRAAGIEVKIDPKPYPNGRFARLQDPEGNPIELWQFEEPRHGR